MGVRNASAVLVLLAAASSAQQEILTWTDGVLGSKVTYSMQGDPFELWGLGVSTNGGPTPIALIDPSDPRKLSIGIELFPQIWAFGQFPANGLASYYYDLSANPSAVGVALHAQFMTVPGATTIIDDLSNATSFRLQMPETTALTIKPRAGAIDEHSSTSLPNGRVLLAGGADHKTGSEVVLATAEVFDPPTQTFIPVTATMAAPRRAHTATALDDGRVLLAGGRDGVGNAVATAEIYTATGPTTSTFTAAASMASPRSRHTATRLADGRVLVVGGLAIDDPADPIESLLAALRTTEIYDPVTDSWTAGPELPTGLVGHAASLLPNGEVFVSGGVEIGSLFGFPTQHWTEAAWRYDPLGNEWLPAAPMPAPRAYHAQIVGSTDGRAVATGGTRNGIFLEQIVLDEVDRYDPLTDAWETLAPLAKPRARHAIVEVGGELIVAGGVAVIDLMTLIDTPEPSIEVGPLDGSDFGPAFAMQRPRGAVRVSPFDGGVRLLITGTGDNGGPPDQTGEMALH